MKAPREEKENPRALPPLELSAALEYNPSFFQSRNFSASMLGLPNRTP